LNRATKVDEAETTGRSVRRWLAAAAWAPVAVLVAHEVGARWLGHEPVVDPVMHFSGGAAIAFFVHRGTVVARRLFGAQTALATDLLSFGLACTAALFWELAEQLSDVYLGTHAHVSVGATLRDLWLGAAGALVYVVSARVVARVRSDRVS
jgi:hypothetical protein